MGFIFAYSFLSSSWLCFSLKHICPSGQENAANVSLEVLKALPRLQQRDQSRGGRFGDGGGRGGGNRFGRGGGGRNGRFSNDRFSNGGGRGGRGNWGGKRW